MSDVLFGDEHVRKYEETGGEVGHVWQDGVPTLVLTTTGRKSGAARKSALIYQTHEDSYVVVASKGGAPDDPAWYKNLVADPNVEVQVGAAKFNAVARTAGAEEKSELWPLMAAVWPSYDDYRVKTNRDIPVVLLDPA